METQRYVMVNDGARNFLVWLSFSHSILVGLWPLNRLLILFI